MKLAINDVDDVLTTRAKGIAIQMGRIVGDVRIDNSDGGQKFAKTMTLMGLRHITRS